MRRGATGCRRDDAVGTGDRVVRGDDRGRTVGPNRGRAGREGGRAPEDGTVKVTVPPATGSSGLLAVTTTASGSAKAVPSVVCWRVLPATGVIVNPWLWKAPISGGESSGSPRSSVVTPLTAVPAPMAGLPGKRAMVAVGPP